MSYGRGRGGYKSPQRNSSQKKSGYNVPKSGYNAPTPRFPLDEGAMPPTRPVRAGARPVWAPSGKPYNPELDKLFPRTPTHNDDDWDDFEDDVGPPMTRGGPSWEPDEHERTMIKYADEIEFAQQLVAVGSRFGTYGFRFLKTSNVVDRYYVAMVVYGARSRNLPFPLDTTPQISLTQHESSMLFFTTGINIAASAPGKRQCRVLIAAAVMNGPVEPAALSLGGVAFDMTGSGWNIDLEYKTPELDDFQVAWPKLQVTELIKSPEETWIQARTRVAQDALHVIDVPEVGTPREAGSRRLSVQSLDLGKAGDEVPLTREQKGKAKIEESVGELRKLLASTGDDEEEEEGQARSRNSRRASIVERYDGERGESENETGSGHRSVTRDEFETKTTYKSLASRFDLAIPKREYEASDKAERKMDKEVSYFKYVADAESKLGASRKDARWLATKRTPKTLKELLERESVEYPTYDDELSVSDIVAYFD